MAGRRHHGALRGRNARQGRAILVVEHADLGAWLSGLSGLRVRVLHHVCVRPRAVSRCSPGIRAERRRPGHRPVITRALVLTAGLGTRLRPLTDVRAKPAIPVAGEPMIRRIVRWLVSRGVSDLVLNLHHLPATITAVVGEGRDLGARVRYSWEQPVILGSGGGPRLALPLVGADPFFVIN